MVTCPNCEGYGEIQHPRWGARNCPEPTIPCPLCHGNCEVSQATKDAWEEEQEANRHSWARFPRQQPTQPTYEGEEPF